MRFLHTDFSGGPDLFASVTLDRGANVMLLDDVAFASYKRGGSFRYYGGWASRSPVVLSPPHYAHWHVVIDLGGQSGTVCAGVRILRRSAQGMLF